MGLSKDVMTRLSKFFDSYKRKIDFLEKLSREKEAADEIILLACCYIDQLGGCLFSKTVSSKRSFEQMLFTHSGEKEEFSLISVADLAFDILYALEIADYLVPKPGRIQLPSDIYKPLLNLISQLDISLTANEVSKFCTATCDALKADFRIYPHQTANKDSYGDRQTVIDSLQENPKLRRLFAESVRGALNSFIDEYKYTSILYREYRSKAVHEAAGIRVDLKKFWNKKRPYFAEGTNLLWRPYSFFKLEFPASFLIACLQTCVKCAEKAIIGKGLLPLPIWDAICDLEEVEFLDEEGIEEAKPIKLKID